MLFKRKHLKKILSGRKTQTRRRIRRQTYKIGGKISARNGWFKKAEHRILIKRRFKQRLGDMSIQDVYKEGYETLEEYKDAWIEINGNWNPDEVVLVYEFELVNNE